MITMITHITTEATLRQAELEEAVEKAKNRCALQAKSLEMELQDVAAKNAELRGASRYVMIALGEFLIVMNVVVSGEKAVRESRSFKDSVAKLQKALEDERKAFESSAKELGDRYLAAMNAKEEEARKRVHVQNLNTELRETIDKLRSQVRVLSTHMSSC